LFLKEPKPMIVVARELGMEERKTFETGDIVGTMQWRGGTILVMLHLSSGDMVFTEKIEIYAHHVEETEYDEFWKLVIEMLKDIIRVEEVPEEEKSYDYRIKRDGD